MQVLNFPVIHQGLEKVKITLQGLYLSAYKTNHSTKTLLLKINSNLLDVEDLSCTLFLDFKIIFILEL